MNDVVLMVLTSATIVYAFNNIINLVNLDRQTSEEIGELLPTSSYVYTSLNYVFRIALIYISMKALTHYNFYLNGSNVFWVVLLIVMVTTLLSTLLEVLLRTVVFMISSRRGEESDD